VLGVDGEESVPISLKIFLRVQQSAGENFNDPEPLRGGEGVRLSFLCDSRLTVREMG
jgi:hypothetical protein